MYNSARQAAFLQNGRNWKITVERPGRRRGRSRGHHRSRAKGQEKSLVREILLFLLLTGAVSVALAGMIMVALAEYDGSVMAGRREPFLFQEAAGKESVGAVFAVGTIASGGVLSIDEKGEKRLLAEADGALSLGAEKNSPSQKAYLGIPLIVIDAGHGGEDNGCTREGVDEKEINLSIAKLVEKKLTGMGYQVIMTREDDSYLSVEDRVKLANESGADLYISIHQNAYEQESAEGIEVWYNREKGGEDNRRLALLLGQQTIKQTGATARELQEDSQMYGVIHTTMPACLIETGFLSNKAEREKLVTAEYQEQIAEGIARAIQYYYQPKTMYLTFDDGPFKENTSRVLDILKERKIKATFFVIGEYVEKNPQVARRIVEEGHSIGIHCYNHDYKRLYASVDSFVEDFEKAHQIVLEVTGVDAKIFRFPGGSINGYNKEVKDGIIQEMTGRGYVYYDWNASLEDAVGEAQPQQLIANAVESTFGRKKVIMLAHDTVYTTGICLEELLDQFPEYRMEVLTKEVEPIQF